MYRIIGFLIFFEIFLIRIKATQVEIDIGIYCSDEIYLVDRYYRICKWLYSNGTTYYDTLNSAEQDCPNGYILGGIKNITRVKINIKSCNSYTKIWINETSSNGNNSMIMYQNGSIVLLNDKPGLLYDGFLCYNNTQNLPFCYYLDKFCMRRQYGNTGTSSVLMIAYNDCSYVQGYCNDKDFGSSINGSIDKDLFNQNNDAKFKVDDYLNFDFDWIDDITEAIINDEIFYFAGNEKKNFNHIVKLNESGGWVKHVDVPKPVRHLQSAFNSLFVTFGDENIYQFDFVLNQKQIFNSCIFVYPYNGMNDKMIHVFDSNLCRIAYYRVSIPNNQVIRFLKVFDSKFYLTVNNGIYVFSNDGTFNNKLSNCRTSTTELKRFSIDSDGNIAYACENSDELIFINKQGSPEGKISKDLNKPCGVLFDSRGRIVSFNHGLQFFF